MLFSDDITLPRFSNREDLYLLIGIYDDDTGEPLNLSGCTGGIGGQSASWTVTITALPGIPNSVNVVTSSLTLLTIASGTQTLTIARNLTIFPQQPVTLADTSGGGTMFGTVLSYVPTTGVLQVSIGMQFTFEIRRAQPRNVVDGYVSWWGIGTTADYGPLIVAYTGSGISIIDLGIIQIEILETRMRQLWTPNYGNTFGVGLQMFDGHSTRQIFTGSLPIVFGGVTN